MKLRTIFSSTGIVKLFLWACLWSGILGALKLLILLYYRVYLPADYLLGMVGALAGSFCIGIIIACLLFHSNTIIRISGQLIGSLVYIFSVISFHYEIIFQRLPDFGVLYYLKEIPHLAPSLQNVAPPLVLLLEILVGIAVIFVGVAVINRSAIASKTSPQVAGFDWVEIDVQMTRDNVPVLLHDYVISDGKGNQVNVAAKTYREILDIPGYSDVLTLENALSHYGQHINFLIEIKSVRRIDRNYLLNRQIVELIQRLNMQNRVVVDSFQELTASFIKNRCQCDVALDTPYKKVPSKRMLEMIAQKELDWVYLHHSVVDQKLIQNAHDKGLRVMVYTINEMKDLKPLAGNLPDGIITDRIDLKEKYMEVYGKL